ncbi:MAG: S-layer homology domain-containing protein, partial [Caryophanon sp.]|nr:S-layer homology domain-containing protein [Caryophanon sp.]
ALAPRKEREDVAKAIERAVNALHASYIENGVDNANTAAAFISGLGSVGENIFSDKWTDWQGRQLVQHLVADYQLETGEFLWKEADEDANAMATEQAIIALGDALNGYSSFSKQALDQVRKTVEEPVETPEQPTIPTNPEMPAQPTQPTTPEQPAPQMMKVYVSIDGLQSIVEQQEVTLPKEATVLDALQAVAAANGVSVSIRSTTYGLYVEGINGLMEMKYGKTSGWMYSVNGSFPERSADKEKVADGDIIAWSYTYDEATVPSNPSPSLPSNPSQPSQPSTPEQPVTPEQPTTPEQPVTPEEPTEPETPVTPEEPTEPEAPVTPEKPTEPEAPVTLPFTDIEPTNYSAPYIAKLYELGITTGTTDTTFSPKANLTRSQFAVMIARALKLEPKGAPTFKDVQGKWYADSVQALVENGIVQGVDENTFAPGNTITRQQTAVMLFRVLQFAGYDALADVPTFNDAANISPYAQQAFATLQKLNILTGNEGFANPHEQLTRQQMAKLLVLTLEAIQK